MVSRSVVWSLVVLSAWCLAACTSNAATSPPPDESPIASEGALSGDDRQATTTYRIVTLGDSYAFGTGTDAPRRDSWPGQLATAMTERGGLRIYLRNLAQEGSPSEQVLEEQVGQVAANEPDVIMLQVGVNDIVGNEAEGYDENIAAIFDELLVILPPERIFAVTTPDHTLTEWGRARGTHAAVEALNGSLVDAATARGIGVIDIGPVNERVAVDDSLLVQTDPPEPYPTAKQYAAWAEVIGPFVYEALAIDEP